MDAQRADAEALHFGDVADSERPLAILLHGFPDTPHTWRHLGPALADQGWRVVAPWLPGYRSGEGPISVGTYVRAVLDCRETHRGDERAVLIAHDWGANAAYGVTAMRPQAFSRLVTLAVPPMAALGEGMLQFEQLRRSFYVWLIQVAGLAEMALAGPGFLENLWRSWSPGYDPLDDVARFRELVETERFDAVVAPYRAQLGTAPTAPGLGEEEASSGADPAVATLYLHGSDDGALGADVLADVATHLPVAGSRFEVLDGVGHFLHLEDPERVNRLILDWLGLAR